MEFSETELKIHFLYEACVLRRPVVLQRKFFASDVAKSEFKRIQQELVDIVDRSVRRCHGNDVISCQNDIITDGDVSLGERCAVCCIGRCQTTARLVVTVMVVSIVKAYT